MAGEGYPAGNGGTVSAASLLLRLTGAATLAVGAMLYGDGDASLATLTLGAQNTVLVAGASAPAWSTSLALTGAIASKQAAAAGISLDHNAATGNFTLRLSPANLATANRRATFPDADFTVAGLSIAQTFSAANTFSADVTFQNPVYFGKTGSGTGGTFRLLNDGGTNQWYIGISGGAGDKDYVMYDYTSTIERLRVNQSTGQFLWTGPGRFTGILTLSGIIPSTSTTTGNLVNAGGFGNAGAAFIGGGLTVSGDNATISSASTTAQVVVTTVAAQTAQFHLRGNNVASGLLVQHDGSSDATVLNLANRSMYLGTNALTRVTIAATGEVSLASSTASTTTGTGGLVVTGGAGVGGQVTAKNFLATVGTITSALPAIDSTVTWNAGGVTFTGWKLNATSSASAAGSLLLDLQLGGTSQFTVRKDSLLTMAGLAYSGASNGEIWHDTTQKAIKAYVNGIQRTLVGTIYSAVNQTGTGPSSTASETSIVPTTFQFGTTTLPANFWTTGKTLRITIHGRINNASSTPTLTVRAKIGSTTIIQATGTMLSLSGNQFFTLVVEMFCTATGGSGTVLGQARLRWNSGTGDVAGFDWNTNTATVDTTTTGALDVTAQFGTAGTNVMVGNTTTIEALN